MFSIFPRQGRIYRYIDKRCRFLATLVKLLIENGYMAVEKTETKRIVVSLGGIKE